MSIFVINIFFTLFSYLIIFYIIWVNHFKEIDGKREKRLLLNYCSHEKIGGRKKRRKEKNRRVYILKTLLNYPSTSYDWAAVCGRVSDLMLLSIRFRYLIANWVGADIVGRIGSAVIVWSISFIIRFVKLTRTLVRNSTKSRN